MALHLATFRTRTITAAIFVVVMLAGLFLSRWTFFFLFSVIHFGCWIEYQKLIRRIDPDYADISPVHKYGVMIAGWCFMLYFTDNSFQFLGISLHSLGWWIGMVLAFVLPISELLISGNLKLKTIGYSALGLLYISFTWGLLMDIYCMEIRHREVLSTPGFNENFFSGTRILLPIVMIATIWINDTMAYLVGSLIGKTPFSKISPKKTWEGTAGGALLAIIIVSFSMIYIEPKSPLWFWLAFTSIAAISGTLGDLLESKLKRMADVKDSGKIMPGHGGFLDRFDSLLLAIPFIWIYLSLIF